MMRVSMGATLLFISCAALGAPITYNIDPEHTFPSFETDHMNGLSVWRGKFNKTSGTVLFDRAGHSGEMDITVDAGSIDFGLDKLNEAIKGPSMFDVEHFPTATYKGRFSKFNGDVPIEAVGELTLHGVTKPLTLTINSFMCKLSSRINKEVCGADVAAMFNRAEFGITVGQQMGYKQVVKLAIQVEAIKAGS